MQIVIDISDDDYEWIREFNAINYGIATTLYGAVYNGKPLPKGHDKLIDVKTAYREFTKGNFYIAGEEHMKYFLESIPAIIDAEVEE